KNSADASRCLALRLRASIVSPPHHPRSPVARPAFFLKKESAPAEKHISSRPQFKKYGGDEHQGIKTEASGTNAEPVEGARCGRRARRFINNLQPHPVATSLEM